MKVDSTKLREILDTASFEGHGDAIERLRGHYLANSFPNCEVLWRYFVIPLTSRIETYPDPLGVKISFRPTVADEVRQIAAANYSMFSHLADTHYHLEDRQQCWFEDAYVHLGAACDLAESVLEEWHLLRTRCLNKRSHILQELSRKEFLDIAGKWYDEKYPSTYEHYLSRGKPPPMKLPSRGDLLTEYFGRGSKERKAYAAESQRIRQYRNIVVHNVKIGRMIPAQGEILVPKAQAIAGYRTWSDVEAAAQDNSQAQRDFESQSSHITNAVQKLEQALNPLWEVVISDFDELFFRQGNQHLHSLFDVSFDHAGPYVATDDSVQPLPPAADPPPSGTYAGGSAAFTPSENEE